MTSVTAEYSQALSAWTLKIVGTSIVETDPSEITVLFGGKECTTLAPITSTEFSVQIVDLESSFVDNSIEIFFSTGTPLPAQPFTAISEADIYPQIVELSTNVGST